MNPTPATKFTTWCGLTCLGGSERKLCPCTGRNDCQLRDDPDFPAARQEARTRILRLHGFLPANRNRDTAAEPHDAEPLIERVSRDPE